MHLAERGKEEEPLAVLRELVASRDAADEETYTAAGEVLEDLEGAARPSSGGGFGREPGRESSLFKLG